MDFISRDSELTSNPIQRVVAALDERTRDINTSIFSGQRNISLESLNDSKKRELVQTSDQIKVALESIRSELNMPNEFLDSQIQAAQQAGIMAGNWMGFQNRSLRDNAPSGSTAANTVTLESYGMADVVGTRSYAMESYDERDNKSAVAYSITYNLQSARQDEFGEALYPTITIPADQMGVSIVSNLLIVMDNVDRDVGGATYQMKRKNVLRAVADSTVLRKDQTRAMPVNRAQSAAQFVSTSDVASVTVNLDGTDISTGPLLFGKTIDLLGISQSDAMLAAGVQNQTDTLEPSVLLQTIYFKTTTGGTNVLKFNVENLPFFNFVPSVQGDYKAMTLNSQSTSLLLNNQSVQASGAALAGPLAQIVTDNLIVRLSVTLSGALRTDTSNISVYSNGFSVYSITDANGNNVALTDSSVTALVNALNAAVGLGYTPLAYRSNQNRRQQGQFVDVVKEYQRYMVPLRSPITARHPAHIDGMVDASDVQALITTTRIRMANEAVTTILQAADLLAQFIDVRDIVNEAPEVLGVGRHYVRPYFLSRTFNAATKIDSVRSQDRALDIQAGLVNELRDMAYLLYRQSEYKAASDAIYGSAAPVPTVILATDPYTARYLSVNGDLRTLGGEFQVMVVSTLDIRFRGKIVVAFGSYDTDRNTSVNPLNNGNLLWAPELVLTANISRAGQYSRETLVQPRYRFIQNLPVLGLLTVTNIPSVLNKVPLYMQDTTP